MVIKNSSKGTVLAHKLWKAETLLEKIGGLIIRPPLQDDEALVIPSLAPWVHSFFMRYPIDVLILNRDGTCAAAKTLPPWRMMKMYPRAVQVVELKAGVIEKSKTHAGDRIEIA